MLTLPSDHASLITGHRLSASQPAPPPSCASQLDMILVAAHVRHSSYQAACSVIAAALPTRQHNAAPIVYSR